MSNPVTTLDDAWKNLSEGLRSAIDYLEPLDPNINAGLFCQYIRHTEPPRTVLTKEGKRLVRKAYKAVNAALSRLYVQAFENHHEDPVSQLLHDYHDPLALLSWLLAAMKGPDRRKIEADQVITIWAVRQLAMQYHKELEVVYNRARGSKEV